MENNELINLIESVQTEYRKLKLDFEIYRSQKDAEFESLQERLYDLEEKKKQRTKKNVESLVELQEFKENFIISQPEQRTDPFSDEELVLWYVLMKIKKNPSETERITNFSELYKRVSKIKIMYEHFLEMGKNINIPEDKLELFARSRCKNYLEYCVFAVDENNKQNEFYFVTSQYCLNKYSANIGSWQKIKNIDDSPAEE